jgi:hypothetical protein
VPQKLELEQTVLAISEGNAVKLGTIHDNRYVNRAGDTMTGPLDISATGEDTPPLRISNPDAGEALMVESEGDGIVVNAAAAGIRSTSETGSSFDASGTSRVAMEAFASGDGAAIGVFARASSPGGFGLISRAQSFEGTAKGIVAQSFADEGTALQAELRQTSSLATSTAFLANHFGGEGTIARFQGNSSDVYVIQKNGDAQLTGTHFAANHVNTSDARLKEDIAPLEEVLSKLEGINGVTFRFRDAGTGPTDPQVGLLAQEVQAVFPELVEERTDGYLGVSYGHMTAVLLEAIKEQQRLIEAQQEQINRLQDAIGGEHAAWPVEEEPAP